MKTTKVYLLALAVTLVTAGCDTDHCDPDQVVKDELCVYPSLYSDDAAKFDGFGDLACGSPTSGFGAPCRVATQCPCGLTDCTVLEDQNYCTRSNCADDVDVCPAGWSCVDLAGDGLPSICVRPGE